MAITASCLSVTPAPVQELFWRGVPLIPLPLPLLNIICTNVPGSPTPLYTVGRRLLAAYPHVPTGYELGLGVAVQSYDGKLFFGLTADAHVAPDVGKLRDYIQVCFRELSRAAGVKGAGAARKPAASRPTAKPRAARRREPNKVEEAPVAAAPVNGASQMAPEVEPVVPAVAAPAGNGDQQPVAQAQVSFEPEAVLV